MRSPSPACRKTSVPHRASIRQPWTKSTPLVQKSFADLSEGLCASQGFDQATLGSLDVKYASDAKSFAGLSAGLWASQGLDQATLVEKYAFDAKSVVGLTESLCASQGFDQATLDEKYVFDIKSFADLSEGLLCRRPHAPINSFKFSSTPSAATSKLV
jgi:hypothetical protein